MTNRTAIALAVITFSGAALLATVSSWAQSWPQSPGGASGGAPPSSGAQTPICVRLESQLAALDRGAGDAGRADQLRRYEEAANKQQFELDRLTAQARRAGCEGSGFFLFGGQPAQCDGLNGQIQRMRANLDRMNMDLQRLQSGGADRGDQRRAILVALSQNDCGPQYRAAAAPARPRGLFESIFGAPSQSDYGVTDSNQTSTFRTICVRTCDGFYFPISFSTVQSKFAEDERTCQRMCPASEVMLFSHRNPGEEVSQAVSLGGRSYREMPNAFRYRSEYNPSCSCRRPGQSWAEAMGQKDGSLEQGDIVVTEERAKSMSQPRPEPTKSGRQDQKRGNNKGGPTPASATQTQEPPPPEPTSATDAASSDKRSVRTVGPTYYPTR